MADTAHRKTDLKLEEMERRLSAIYSGVEKTVQKKMADYAKSIDEKSAELLQAYKDAETEDEKQKAKKAYIRFYRKLVKSKEFVSLSATVADDLYKANVEASAYINSQTPYIYALTTTTSMLKWQRILKDLSRRESPTPKRKSTAVTHSRPLTAKRIRNGTKTT